MSLQAELERELGNLTPEEQQYIAQQQQYMHSQGYSQDMQNRQ